MNMMFVGPKTSMGYRPGVIYDVQTRLTDVMRRSMIIVSVEGMRPIPYESVEAFLRNWRQL